MATPEGAPIALQGWPLRAAEEGGREAAAPTSSGASIHMLPSHISGLPVFGLRQQGLTLPDPRMLAELCNSDLSLACHSALLFSRVRGKASVGSQGAVLLSHLASAAASSLHPASSLCRTSYELAGTDQFLKALFPPIDAEHLHRHTCTASSPAATFPWSSPGDYLAYELLPCTRGIWGCCQPGCHLPAPPS